MAPISGIDFVLHYTYAALDTIAYDEGSIDKDIEIIFGNIQELGKMLLW